MVEEHFEIQSYQMSQIDSKSKYFFTMVKEIFEIQSCQMLQIDSKS